MGEKEMTKVVLAPMIETLSDPVEFARLYPTESAAQDQVKTRASQAKVIENYFANQGNFAQNSQEAHDAYRALNAIASKNDFNARLALYMPMNFVYTDWEDVKSTYASVWMKLLNYRDVRECFNLGDIYEKDASDGEYEYVIKCLHLLPWLIEDNVISVGTLFMLMDAHESQPLFASCVFDCLEVFKDWGCISDEDFAKLKSRRDNFDYQRPAQKLRYSTSARDSWQDEYCRSVSETPVTLRNVMGPFSKNLTAMNGIIEEAANGLEPGRVALIGGSRAKGYSSGNSDFDIWYFDIRDLERIDPNLAHFVFDTFWVSFDPEIEQKRAKVVAKYLRLPANSNIRRDCLIRLESDLLQFRLMHKGFPYAYGADLSKAMQKFKDIDGSSAFYDIRYRRTASILYAKYVFLPQF